MKVKDWVNFLQNDKQTEGIGLQLKGGAYCPHWNYFPKEQFAESIFKDYMDEEVVKVEYENFKGHTLLIFE